jgi:hypothetical protein
MSFSQVLKSQLSKLGKKYNESIQQQRKLESVIDNLNKDKISLKKQLIESKYEAKQNELLFKNSQDDVLSLKTELKAKGSFILALEKERKKLETQVHRRRESRSRDRDTSFFSEPKTRSMSVDRLKEKRMSLGRKLIKSGQGAAYAVTSNIDADNVGEQEVEKIVMLSRLLLTKTRLNAEKDVQIESLTKEKNELLSQVSRLKKTKYIAEELTQCRHRLSLKTNQLEDLIKEDSKNRNELLNLRTEVIKLRDRLHELYTERNQFIRKTSSNI